MTALRDEAFTVLGDIFPPFKAFLALLRGWGECDDVQPCLSKSCMPHAVVVRFMTILTLYTTIRCRGLVPRLGRTSAGHDGSSEQRFEGGSVYLAGPA